MLPNKLWLHKDFAIVLQDLQLPLLSNNSDCPLEGNLVSHLQLDSLDSNINGNISGVNTTDAILEAFLYNSSLEELQILMRKYGIELITILPSYLEYGQVGGYRALRALIKYRDNRHGDSLIIESGGQMSCIDILGNRLIEFNLPYLTLQKEI